MKTFKNKVAVITGAASGIGRGLALRAQEGMKIVLADVEQEALSATETEMKAAGVEMISVLADISKIDHVKSLAHKTINTYGNVDLLFNNAGVAAGSSLWESTINDCKWVIDVNLWGVIHCIREFVPIMIKQNTPCYIINTSSIAGLSGHFPSSLYQLTKHGIVALSEQLYHDLSIRGTKIKVSVLCPGPVNTNIMNAARNRPKQYRNDPSETRPTPEQKDRAEAFRQMIKNGMPVSQVADCVFKAIANEQFIIFTHPVAKTVIKDRLEDILLERNPRLPSMDDAELLTD
jgi:NADP-dependent 3-hydroxy acid dehydrogenase YdfG